MKKVKPNYYIVVYDAKVKHVAKVLKTLRKYLHWVQNSVFEGPLTYAQFVKLKHELSQIIDPDHDSIIFYKLSDRYMIREIMGREKGTTDMII